MKRLFVAVLATAIGFSVPSLTASENSTETVFSDNFNDTRTSRTQWTVTPGSDVQFLSEGGEDGGGCVRVSTPQRAACSITRKITGLQPERLYRVSARFRCDSVSEGRGAVLSLKPDDSRDQPWNASQFVYGTTGWETVYMDFLSDPAGNASICAGVGFPWPTSNGGTAKGTVYIDDIQVIPTPEEAIYTREGKHIVLRLHRDMVRISDKQADAWIKQLDKAYEAYADLLGETPYDGRKITILNTPGIEPGYWALAGNPILWNSHVAVTQALDNFRKEKDSCFGILHEIGHTFSAGTIGYPDNWNWNDEIFANFRMSYALEKNKTTVIMRDKKYTGAEIKNFYKLFYDETIGAGKPELNGDALHYTFLRIKDRFGWGLYKKAFRALYSLQESDMAHLDSPYKKFLFFLDQLSTQAGEDLYQTMYTPEERALIERAFAAS